MQLFKRYLTLDAADESELAWVVARLPVRVRIAMLDGLRHERIIAGAYVDGRGGICPMLAAHRHGARVTRLEFADTWDAFVTGTRRGRPASPTEVDALAHALRRSLERELRSPVGGTRPDACAHVDEPPLADARPPALLR